MGSIRRRCGPRRLSTRHPRLVVVAVPVGKRHWQKLTVLSRGANRSTTFRKGSGSMALRRDGGTGRDRPEVGVSRVNGLRAGGSRAGLTQRKRVSTLEQSPERRRHGSEPGSGLSIRVNRAGFEQDAVSLPTAIALACELQAQCRWPNATRRDSRGQGQADLPAEQPAPRTGAWIPAPDAHARGPRDRDRPAPQGASLADCLILTGSLRRCSPRSIG